MKTVKLNEQTKQNENGKEDDQTSFKSKKTQGLSRKREIIIVNSQTHSDNQSDYEPRAEQNQQDDCKIANELQQVVFKVKLKKNVKKMANQTSKRRLQFLNEGKFHYLNDKATNQHLVQNKLSTHSEIEGEQKGTILAQQFRELLSNKQRVSLKNLIKRFPVFSPSHKFKLVWDIIMNGLSILTMFFIPISYIYNKPLQSYLNYGFNVIIPLFLVIDMLFSCNTSYYEKGRHEIKRKKILKNYVKNYFISDLFPIILYFLIILLDKQNSIIRLFTLLFFTKIAQIWRIFRKFEESTSLSRFVSNFIQLLQLLILILFVSHLFASVWLYIGLNTQSIFDSTWIQYKGIANADWKVQYLNAYYYAVVTMITVGYGDITPQNNIEMVFTISAMMVCCGVFAYSLNQVGSIFDAFFQLETEVRKNMSIINSYMEGKKVSKHLQYQVRQYLDFYWREEFCNNVESQMKIINQLSGGLKETLLMEANKVALIDSLVFRENFSKALVAKTVPLIKEIRVTPEEKIFSQDDTDDCQIYFIEKGRVEVYSYYAHPIVKKQKMINSLQVLSSGNCFGELSFFTGQSRKFTVRSLEFSTILSIKRSDFIQLLQEFPDDYEKFCMIRDQINLHQDYRPIGVSCYACNMNNHTLGDCPILHFIPKKQKIIHEHACGILAVRQQFHRKKNKMNIAPHQLDEISQELIYQLEDEVDQYIQDYLKDTDEEEDDDEEEDCETNQKQSQLTHQQQQLKQQQQQQQQTYNFTDYTSDDFMDKVQENRTSKEQYNKGGSNISNNQIQFDSFEPNTPSLKNSPLKSGEQKFEISKQKIQQSVDFGSQVSNNNTTMLQLLPKFPSQNSLTEKIFKENILPEETQIAFQLDSQNSITIEHNAPRRPSIFKINFLNNQNLSSLQIEKEQQQEDTLKPPGSLKRILPSEQQNNDPGNQNFNENNNHSSVHSGMVLGVERKSSKRQTNTTKGSQRFISEKISSALQTNKINRKQSNSINESARVQSGKKSVALLEKTLTNIQNNGLSRVSQKKTLTYEYENQIYSFFNQQLKHLKGFYEDLDVDIVTDTMKEYKIYYPKYNYSVIIERINWLQDFNQNLTISKHLRKITKASNMKKQKSKENNQTVKDDSVQDSQTDEHHATNQEDFAITNMTNNNNNHTEYDKKEEEDVFVVLKKKQNQKSVSTIEDQNVINITVINETNRENQSLPVQSFIEDSQTCVQDRQINDFTNQQQKRQVYYDTSSYQQINFNQSDHN